MDNIIATDTKSSPILCC